jgi:hypothetical protein
MAIDVDEIARSASFRGALDEKARAALQGADKLVPGARRRSAPGEDPSSRTDLVLASSYGVTSGTA